MSKWALFLLHNTWHCAMPSWRWLWSRTGNADALRLLLLNSQATARANVAGETLRGHFSLWSASGSPRSSASFQETFLELFCFSLIIAQHLLNQPSALWALILSLTIFITILTLRKFPCCVFFAYTWPSCFGQPTSHESNLWYIELVSHRIYDTEWIGLVLRRSYVTERIGLELHRTCDTSD